MIQRLIPRGLFRIAPSVLLVLASFPGCVQGSRLSKKTPPLLWMERTVVVSTTTPESQLDPSLRPHLEKVQSRGSTSYYLAPIDLKDELERQGFRKITSPPFSYLSPDIHRRRASHNIAELWNGYKDEVVTEKILQHLARSFPDYAYLMVIGKSHNGRPIYALRISDHPGMDEDEPSFLFDATIHGNEPLSIDYVLDGAMTLLASTIADQSDEAALKLIPDPTILQTAREKKETLAHAIKNYESWFVPIVNPDGVHYFWNENSLSGRKNIRSTDGKRGYAASEGVDLNRNFPFFWNSGRIRASSGNPHSVFYRGPRPASEVETIHMIRFAEEQRFIFALTYHSFATKVLVPYTADGAASPYPSAVWEIGKELAEHGESYRPDKQYTAARNIYSVDGTDQDYYFNKYGTLAYIVEGSYHSPVYDRNGRRTIRGMRPLTIRVYDIFARGPTLVLHVQDMSGRPLHANVTLPDIVYMEGERFTTHKKTGRFDYILPRPGRYRIQVGLGEKEKVEKTIECEKGICPVTIRIPRS